MNGLFGGVTVFERVSFTYTVFTEDSRVVGTVAGNYAEIEDGPLGAYLFIEGDGGFIAGKLSIPEDGYIVRAELDSNGNRVLEEVEIIWPLEIDEDAY